MKTRTTFQMIAVMAAGLLLWACGGMEQPEDSIETVQEALELEDGGYDLGDELPAFGMPELDALPVDVSNLVIPEEPDIESYLGIGAAAAKTGKAPCPHGYLKGVWKPFVAGKPYGVFKGKWVTANGKVDGYLKGIYGKNLMGHGVLFGKYIDPQGKARGLLRGLYGNGFFRARWHGKYGLTGSIHGVYGQNVFKGKWHAFCNFCNLPCKPGFKQAGPGKCFCVPAKVVPCVKGKCPAGMFCNPCPRPDKCKDPKVKCPAVCAPPVCMPKPVPPKSTDPASSGNSAGLR